MCKMLNHQLVCAILQCSITEIFDLWPKMEPRVYLDGQCGFTIMDFNICASLLDYSPYYGPLPHIATGWARLSSPGSYKQEIFTTVCGLTQAFKLLQLCSTTEGKTNSCWSISQWIQIVLSLHILTIINPSRRKNGTHFIRTYFGQNH